MVQVLIPSTACVWVMLFYLSLGTVMFAEWEQWDYLDSAYFCTTSLLKVNKQMLSVLYCLLGNPSKNKSVENYTLRGGGVPDRVIFHTFKIK